MEISRNNKDDVIITMKEYIKKILKDNNIINVKSTPGLKDDYKFDETKKVSDNSRVKYFHTNVAKLLYLAMKIRTDIITQVSNLCSFVNNPTEKNFRQLIRILEYLNGTTNYGIKFTGGGEMILSAYGDAAFMLHCDVISRGGIVLLLNGAVIYARSSKQKHITKSSTEAELVTLDDTAMVVIGVRKFLVSQGYEPGSVTIFQDNKSVISLIKAGKPNNLRTKHISMKYFSIVEYIRDGLINVEWMRTEDMAADMLSKSLVGVDFERNRDKFLIEIL